MIQVKSYLKVLKKAKLTQAQYLLLHCLHFKLYIELKEYMELFPPPSDKLNIIGDYWFKDLLDRGYLTSTNSRPTEARHYKVGQKFLDIFIDKYLAIEEIWEYYPDFMIKGDKRYPLKAVDQEKMAELYFEKIGGIIIEHIEIITDIKFMVDNNLVYCSLEKFIGSKGWIGIRKIRKDGTQNIALDIKMY